MEYKVVQIVESVQYDESDVESGRNQQVTFRFRDAASAKNEWRTATVSFDNDLDAACITAATAAIEADLGIV